MDQRGAVLVLQSLVGCLKGYLSSVLLPWTGRDATLRWDRCFDLRTLIGQAMAAIRPFVSGQELFNVPVSIPFMIKALEQHTTRTNQLTSKQLSTTTKQTRIMTNQTRITSQQSCRQRFS